MSHSKRIERVKALLIKREVAVKEAKRLSTEIMQELIELHTSKAWLFHDHKSMQEFLSSLKPGISASYFFRKLKKARNSGGVK